MLDLPAQPVHLTYCTNIHAGESWPEVRVALARHLPEVKRRSSPNAPMGVGLRLSAMAAETLAEDGESLAWLRDFLGQHGLYVFTLNGFPYGTFHGVRVKEQVYQPDWRHPARLAYTNRLADLLAALLPDQPGLVGSVSTVPGGFRDIAGRADAAAEITEALLRHAAHLVALQARTGRTILLALEPEPMCLLETTEEAAAFLEANLFSRTAIARFVTLSGLSAGQAEEALHRHIGLCYDVCHAAVEFEDPAAGLQRLSRSGIGVGKVQLSSALRIPRVDTESAALLRHFDDGVYLHQVVARQADGHLLRYLDLGDALAALRRDGGVGQEWRVHFHVPIFHDDLGPFATTQHVLREVLALQRQAPISTHLEVETYTWDVLPPELRREAVAEAIARELDWVRRELAA